MIPIEKLYKILAKLSEESFQAQGYSSPNPPVAALITDTEFNIIKSAHTDIYGKNHAERELYFNFKENIKHYLFVTLEPCTHFGKTPPCFELIEQYRPIKVFLGESDPNPLVREKNIQSKLKELNIEYIYLNQIKEISEIYLKGFFSRMKKNRPKLIYKMALSKEGNYCYENKNPVPISNSFSNEYTNLLRAKVDAIIVGPKTIFFDSPKLNLKNISISKSFKANSIYYNKFFKKENFEFIKNNFLDFSPLRIFLISTKLGFKENFLETQNQINQSENRKKTIFILVGDKIEREKLIPKLKSITDNKIYELDKITKTEFYFIFQEYNLNQVLIEGGNFLYKIFEDDLDELIEIHSETSIEEGFKPDFKKENLKLIDEVQVSSDKWKIYKSKL